MGTAVARGTCARMLFKASEEEEAVHAARLRRTAGRADTTTPRCRGSPHASSRASRSSRSCCCCAPKAG